MDIDLDKSGKTLKVVINGNIDTDGGHKLSVKLEEIMDMKDINHVIFNMATVKTITSSGIGKLLNFYKYMDSKGGSMEVKGISESLYKQFLVIHLDRIFPISKEEE